MVYNLDYRLDGFKTTLIWRKKKSSRVLIASQIHPLHEPSQLYTIFFHTKLKEESVGSWVHFDSQTRFNISGYRSTKNRALDLILAVEPKSVVWIGRVQILFRIASLASQTKNRALAKLACILLFFYRTGPTTLFF